MNDTSCRRRRRASCLAATLALLAAGVPSPVRGGVSDSPLPTFSDGKPAVLAALIPAVVKDNNLETAVICTNLATAAVDIGLEVFDEAGTRGNTVATGNGAQLNVAPGQTVTIATGSTAVLHEDRVITLEAPVTGLGNGSGRVVATSARLGCVALAMDKLHTIEDPSVCPTCQPPSLGTLPLSMTPACLLDVDGNGVVDVATDVVYIARHLLGLVTVPPSFRVINPNIPADAVIAGRIDAVGAALDVDGNGVVDVATDVVYIARHLLGLVTVPPSFRVINPDIPADAVIAARTDALCLH